MNTWTLKGKKALITGGTKGIGKATAKEFADLGATLCIIARTKEDVNNIIDKFSEQGHTVLGYAGDVASEKDRIQLIKTITEEWGQLDILVNNVGTNIRKPTLEFETEDLQTILKVNVESAFDLSRRLYPLLKDAEDPVIINIASIASQRAVKLTSAAYSMSKAAMEQMTNFLAVEWGSDGIRVNSLHPWFIKTPLAKKVLEDPEKRNLIISNTPLGRVGEPEDVARAAAFLAMPAANYISGVNLQVDGAFSKKGV